MSAKNLLPILTRNTYLFAGLVIVCFFVALALFGLFYLPHNPLESVGPDYAPPSLRYLFGTTNIGQDVFSQWIFGARSTLLVGFLSGLITILIGLAVGIVAGFISLMDEPLMRVTDIFLAMPTLPLLIAIAEFVKPSIYSVSFLIAVLIGWPGTARVVRSSVLSLKTQPYIEVAKLSGVPSYKIMFEDIIRHILPLSLTYSLFSVIAAVLTEASLDFIGVGPSTDYSWGAQIELANQANAVLFGAWWWFLIPGLSIAIFSTGIALLAYGLESIFKEM
jgi:peptide/nickel transport system permease protein